ncbi:MAG: hypothetical protein JXR95_03485 [Deltaproteobacteria bacterium]|nr:hypothetical protein [Deltaproteobacteria bacterium]
MNKFLFTIILIFPAATFAQKSWVASIDAGSQYPDPGVRLSLAYVHPVNESWSFEGRGFFFNSKDNYSGYAGGALRLVYAIDFLSIIPSAFISFEGGYHHESSKGFMGIDYGLRFEYLYSRKIRFSLECGGINIMPLDESNSMYSGFFLTLGIKRTFGEDW